MITPESTDTALDASQSTRSWVWHSTDDSIAAGQISVLSVVETFCALGLYGWLAFHFEHQWWLLISAIAAPILLLRSPESKTYGLSLLQQYWGDNKGSILDITKKRPYISKAEAIFIRTLLLITTSLILYTIYSDINNITQYPARIIIYLLLAIPIFLLTFFNPLSIVFDSETYNSHSTIILIFGIISASLGAINGLAFIFLFILISATTIHQAHGIFIRCLLIRILSISLHFTKGLRHLPKNWRETLFSIDINHFPELLPGATQVSKELHSGYIFNELIARRKLSIKIHTIIFFAFWYIPTIIWRWSLKATLWLWFPLTLLLRPPFEDKSLEQVRNIAAIRVVVSKWLGFVALLGILLLTASYIPGVQAWVDTLGDSISKPFTKLAEFHLPPPGLRQWALWLCCGLAGLEWLSLVLLQARHKKLLEEEDSIYGGIPEIRLQTFLQRARKVQWLHTALVVSFILFGYTGVITGKT